MQRAIVGARLLLVRVKRAFFDPPRDIRAESNLDILFLVADENSKRLADVRIDVELPRRERFRRRLQPANALHRERGDTCVVAKTREQVQRRAMPHQPQRLDNVIFRRRFPRSEVAELANSLARDRVDKIIDQIVMPGVVDIPTRMRSEDRY